MAAPAVTPSSNKISPDPVDLEMGGKAPSYPQPVNPPVNRDSLSVAVQPAAPSPRVYMDAKSASTLPPQASKDDLLQRHHDLRALRVAETQQKSTESYDIYLKGDRMCGYPPETPTCCSRVIGWFIVAPVAFIKIFDLVYQVYLYEIFHTNWATRLSHFACMDWVVFFMMVWFAQFRWNTSSLDSSMFHVWVLNGALVFACGHALYGLILSLMSFTWVDPDPDDYKNPDAEKANEKPQNNVDACGAPAAPTTPLYSWSCRLWLMGVVFIPVCWIKYMIATAYYEGTRVDGNPIWNPTVTYANPLLWMYVVALFQALGHGFESRQFYSFGVPVPVWRSLSDTWNFDNQLAEDQAKGLRKDEEPIHGKCLVITQAAMTPFYALLELFSSARLLPLQYLRVLFSIGYEPNVWKMIIELRDYYVKGNQPPIQRPDEVIHVQGDKPQPTSQTFQKAVKVDNGEAKPTWLPDIDEVGFHYDSIKERLEQHLLAHKSDPATLAATDRWQFLRAVPHKKMLALKPEKRKHAELILRDRGMKHLAIQAIQHAKLMREGKIAFDAFTI
eukprot:gnl/Hemi2/8756_TR3033_c0_g1_i1.p1 gnl/Hemi2/8756_TR3033_c0_g1~~gnl/Hemi2/8756_TR3033_c0_g1_i1.p1  ORF type:complete len:558 (+),score=174.69 gnl/Hemi2/8756_TR3033_c0_g1_i1:99-1772(+)